MKKNSGLHIILDINNVNMECLYGVDFEKWLNDLIVKSGLSVLGSNIHYFSETEPSFTLNICLSESHVCLHSWPEINYVSADIFVCNYSGDNSKKAMNIKDQLIDFLSYKSKGLKVNEILINR